MIALIAELEMKTAKLESFRKDYVSGMNEIFREALVDYVKTKLSAPTKKKED